MPNSDILFFNTILAKPSPDRLLLLFIFTKGSNPSEWKQAKKQSVTNLHFPFSFSCSPRIKFFIYKAVIFHCLCQIIQSIQHNLRLQFAEVSKCTCCWGSDLSRQHPVHGAQPDPYRQPWPQPAWARPGWCSGAAGTFAEISWWFICGGSIRGWDGTVPSPCSSIAVVWVLTRKWQPHTWALLCCRCQWHHTRSPGSFLLPPQDPLPRWAQRQAPCDCFPCRWVLGSSSWVEGNQLNWATRLRGRRLPGVRASRWSIRATSFPHFLLGAEGTSGCLTPEPLPAANALKSPGSCSYLKLVRSSASSVLGTVNIKRCWQFLWQSPRSRSLQLGKPGTGPSAAGMSMSAWFQRLRGGVTLVWASIPLPQWYLQCGFDCNNTMKGITSAELCAVPWCCPGLQSSSTARLPWVVIFKTVVTFTASLFIYLLKRNGNCGVVNGTHRSCFTITNVCSLSFYIWILPYVFSCGFQVKEDFVF